jgi:Tfp pilus assembly protein PilF
VLNNDNGLAFSSLTIHHFGYLAEEVMAKDKFSRNVAVISKALADNPDDAFLHFSLGIEYLQHQNVKLANESLYKALTLMRGDEGYFRQTLISLMFGLLSEPGNLDIADMFSKALTMFPEDGDLNCLYGLWLLQKERYADAAAVLKLAVQQHAEILSDNQIKALLADAFHLGKLKE